MQDWFHSILEFVYRDNKLDDTYIDISNFLLNDLNISDIDQNKAHQVKNILSYLKTKGFIDWVYMPVGENTIPFGAAHTLNNHDIIHKSVIKYNKVSVKLTLDGYNYFTERERLKQQHDSIITTNESVRITNRKTWIIASLAAFFAMLTFFKGL